MHPCCLVSSRHRFFTQDVHARSTPPLGSILPSVYEDRFHSHQCPLWLPLSAVGCWRHRSAVGGNYEPMGGCHSHSLASSHFVRSILGDQIEFDEVVLEQASRESKLSAKNSLTGRKSLRSNRISAPSGTPGNPSGGGVAYSGSFRTLGSRCMSAFSPSVNVPSEAVDARIRGVMLMDDSSGVGQLRSISWISGSLKPCTHFALHPVSVSFQCRTRREEITRSCGASLITSACVGPMIVTALKSSTPCHSVSIAFKNRVRSSVES